MSSGTATRRKQAGYTLKDLAFVLVILGIVLCSILRVHELMAGSRVSSLIMEPVESKLVVTENSYLRCVQAENCRNG